jgi:hypothetical protein
MLVTFLSLVYAKKIHGLIGLKRVEAATRIVRFSLLPWGWASCTSGLFRPCSNMESYTCDNME